MDEFRTLREYQEYLRERMESARLENAEDKVLYFGFKAGKRKFLIDGKDVEDVNAMSMVEPIPVSKPWAIGAANIKGAVHTITDFAVLFGDERIKRGKFMVLAPEVMAGSAILIESIEGLFEQKDVGQAQPVASTESLPDWVSGFCEIKGEKFFVVEAAKLADDTRFSKLQSGEN